MVKNRKILIIGGTGGIGKEITNDFLKLGDEVVVVSRGKIKSKLKKIKYFQCDTTDQQEYRKVANEIKNYFENKIDSIICLVGDGSGERINFNNIDRWKIDWDKNFNSSFFSVSYFFNSLTNNSSIILISSIAGIEYLGAPDSYSVAKSSIITFTKVLSKYLSPKTRVNCVSPGHIFFKGGSWEKKLKKNPRLKKQIIDNLNPMKRFGTPTDISSAVIFLCSNKATYINGINLVIDGGQINSL